MRFTKAFWPGISDGSITMAFRCWKAPTVVAGRPYRTGGGRVEVLTVDIIDPARITNAQAKKAGLASAEEVRASLQSLAKGRDDLETYRVTFRLLDEPDPRQELANDDCLDAAAIAELDKRLGRLDAGSKSGPWTQQTLELIFERPHTRAPDLAASVGRETQPFKLDVRKLKNLGLTLSFNPGYELSPRGQAYLQILRHRS